MLSTPKINTAGVAMDLGLGGATRQQMQDDEAERRKKAMVATQPAGLNLSSFLGMAGMSQGANGAY